VTRLAIYGAGAFGSALAMTYAAAGLTVTLWARSGADRIAETRETPRLPGQRLSDSIRVTGDPEIDAEIALVAVPTQSLDTMFRDVRPRAPILVSCAKGIDMASGLGPNEILRRHLPGAQVAQLTGPSFAVDIAAGLPTALTLADADAARAAALQDRLTTPALRLYRSTDLVGAELGGALKNVVAIAAGVVIGAGLGQSARAALIARGYAEMSRLALALGARAETLGGLSGLGDLVLTCTSDQSRNFAYGRALGSAALPPARTTVEGRATAGAVAALAARSGAEMPISAMVAELIAGRTDLRGAIAALMARPLKVED
jgi:glycerol-3-phosphate dehydrogenase (NAD(P)+)